MLPFAFFQLDRTALLHTDFDLTVIVQKDGRAGDIAVNQVLGLEKLNTAEHL